MTSSTLKLEPLTLEDVGALSELWFAAFTDPSMTEVFPNTPGVREWLENASREDLANKPFQKYVKIVDTEAVDSQGRPRVAAFAKWDLAMPEERGRRWPPWHEDMKGDTAEKFFQILEGNRTRVMGDQKHFCMAWHTPLLHMHWNHVLTMCGQTWIPLLHTPITNDGDVARGLFNGAAIWQTLRGVSAYVDASKDGAPLYAKHGFVDHSNPGEHVASMARFVKAE
ncbi:acetyltransferase [Penicillium malachiteum]|uniref:acetyltransferase n=1 Tax=Penicillium malachiteum TaxID=1324776 RepID=UPI002547A51F|nr:acetyltransferase [Penicillium malachiteum]KAJ5731744.1 acetyltransferase [Penicillium malachiteum]